MMFSLNRSLNTPRAILRSRFHSWRTLSAIILALFACRVSAEPLWCNGSIEQWGTEEVAMHSSHDYSNPFTDVQFKANFRSGTKSVTVDGFYDGNHIWKIRFMPEEQGEWTIRTTSNDPELNGKTGMFTVTAPAANNHGPVHVAKRFHFSYADGTPYFMLGTTVYGGLTGGAAGRIANTIKLANSSFNKARFMLLPFGGGGRRGAGFEPAYELKPDGTPDYGRPNPRYYEEVENGIRDLRTLGIEVDLILFTPYGGPNSTSNMGEANDIVYLRYVAARLAAYRNVWWTLANEFDLAKYPKDWKKLGTIVHGADPYKHPIGIHQSVIAYYDNFEPWIDHTILQDVTLQRLAAKPRNDANLVIDARKIGKPVVVDEYGYEGDNGTAWGSLGPREEVEEHWAITMAGGYASHGESYSGSMGLPSDRFLGESATRLGFLKKIMMEAPFQEMEPANDLVSLDLPAANPHRAYVVTALAKRGSYYLIYFPEPKEASTWNTGFFGPATPSHPLPIHEPYGVMPPATFNAQTVVQLGEGTFRVDVIDTWLMTVRTIGYTKGPSQQFRTPIAPGVIRFVKVDAVPDGAQVRDVSSLTVPRP